MILSGKKIQELVERGDIVIEPFVKDQMNPNSYNLHLDSHLLRVKGDILSMDEPVEYEDITIPKEGYVLQPGELYLGSTIERTAAKSVVPMIEGRSSIGRLGMFIHVTAGFGDVGFDGSWTLEIIVVRPLKIFASTEVCQIFFHTIDGNYDLYKSNKYQGQTKPRPSRLWREFRSPATEPIIDFITRNVAPNVSRPASGYVKNIVKVAFRKGDNKLEETNIQIDVRADAHAGICDDAVKKVVTDCIESYPRCCDVLAVSLFSNSIHSNAAIFSISEKISEIKSHEEPPRKLLNHFKKIDVASFSHHISEGMPRNYGATYLLRTKCGKHLIGHPERGGNRWVYKVGPEFNDVLPLPSSYEVEYYAELD